MIVRTIFYINDDIDWKDTPTGVIERCFEGTTTLSMEDWLIEHNENRGADIEDKEAEDDVKINRWEEEDEFLVFEHEIN
jgi:hypothetical protein